MAAIKLHFRVFYSENNTHMAIPFYEHKICLQQ